MPKIKSHSGTKKRVKITRKGKIERLRSYGNHFLEKKSSSRKRAIAKPAFVSGRIKKSIKRALGV